MQLQIASMKKEEQTERKQAEIKSIEQHCYIEISKHTSFITSPHNLLERTG